MEATLTAQLADLRALRHEIETSILALATSTDGRRFTFQAPLEPLALRIGGYVMLGEGRLGQVLSLEATRADAGEVGYDGETKLSTRVQFRLAVGEGLVLDGPEEPFHDAPVRPAQSAELLAWLARTEP